MFDYSQPLMNEFLAPLEPFMISTAPRIGLVCMVKIQRGWARFQLPRTEWVRAGRPVRAAQLDRW